MPNETEVFAIDEIGRPVFVELLGSFFKTIAPALAARADEITMTAEVVRNALTITTKSCKGEMRFHLEADQNLNPGIAFLRIRILANMPLDSHETETGIIHVQLNGQRLLVHVNLTSTKVREVLVFKPNWVSS